MGGPGAEVGKDGSDERGAFEAFEVQNVWSSRLAVVLLHPEQCTDKGDWDVLDGTLKATQGAQAAKEQEMDGH